MLILTPKLNETNIDEEVMNSVITESSINNITQRDEESSDESGDDCCVNENSDKEATILTMYKSRDEFVGSKNLFNSLL